MQSTIIKPSAAIRQNYNEDEKKVIIDYVIDDRQNYGSFVH